MDEIDTLDITVEELTKNLKVTWFCSASAWFRDCRDFEAETEGGTYEEAVEKMAVQLTQPDYYATTVYCREVRKLQIPLEDGDGVFHFKEFTNFESHDYHKWRDSIKKHPAFIAEVEKQNKAKADKEKADREAHSRYVREQELAVYEKIKREKENSQLNQP